MSQIRLSNVRSLDQLDEVVERALHGARIPGAAVAIVAGDETVLAKGYGYRDLEARLPVTTETVFPIGSISKGFNATLLGMLVEERRLTWDAPVQDYLPQFRLEDPVISSRVTLRDLITMRTGLPRHDWLWIDNHISRAELVERLQHLELSAAFRERYQYNNLTVTTAGHVAERVTGQIWEQLIEERILRPLGMRSSACARPESGDVTLSYHETCRRELMLTERRTSQVVAPAGGAIHSTVEDMARWMKFNLGDGNWEGERLLHAQTLATVHSAQTVIADPRARKPDALYAMGWTRYARHGLSLLSHGGYLHDVNCEVTLVPQRNLGILSFTNFGPPMMALPINHCLLDILLGFLPDSVLQEQVAQYERQVEETRRHNLSVSRVQSTMPSHALDDYSGVYEHPAYGRIEIGRQGHGLTFRRHRLVLTLLHWQYDTWAFEEDDRFWIHERHPFERASHVLFYTGEEDEVASFSLRLEPAVAPILFRRRTA